VTALPAVDYLIIGHASKDLTPHGPTLGGTVAYAGLTAHALGLRVGVVTSAAEDVDFSPLRDLHVHRVPAAVSTSFENVYTSEGRVQTINGQATALGRWAVPLPWLSAPIVHLAPIACEIDPELANAFPNSFLGMTPQGWMRRWDQAGRVRLTTWEVTRDLLPVASAVVLSIEDLQGDLRAAQAMAEHCRVLVVTEGPRGARVHAQGEWRSVPAPAAQEVDPTGAGDVFAAVFFAQLHRGGDAWQAAAHANHVAAGSVTRKGLASAPDAAEATAALARAGT
jgi:sugar/nucleoside kinase (ribokinase family)